MESQSFDRVVRTLATGTSRRTLLRGLFGGMLAVAGLSRAGSSLAGSAQEEDPKDDCKRAAGKRW